VLFVLFVVVVGGVVCCLLLFVVGVVILVVVVVVVVAFVVAWCCWHPHFTSQPNNRTNTNHNKSFHRAFKQHATTAVNKRSPPNSHGTSAQ